MTSRAAISLTTGLEDPEKVTVAMLVAVGAVEGGREAIMFLTKEAVRLVLPGYAIGVACDGCPTLQDLMQRYRDAEGRFLVCPLCFNSRQLDPAEMTTNAELGGTVQLWEWIGNEQVVTFSY